MATKINVGLFEISPQAGQAGESQIGHKLTAQNTGRNRYMKLIRASVVRPGANAEDIETLEVEAMSPFLILNVPSSDIAYNTVQHVINGESNAEKFRISSTASDKNVVLKPNSGYTINGNEGTFSGGFGLTTKGAVSILVEFTQNITTAVVNIPVLFEIWDGQAWRVAGTYTIAQGTADSGVIFSITPDSIPAFAKEGGNRSVSIESNMGYTIEKQGSSDMIWLTLSRNTGTTGVQSLDLTIAAQEVGAPERNLNLVFKNAVTGSVIGELSVSQSEGATYAIAWEKKTLSFANSEVGIIKNNKLTANADWSIEEVLQ